MADTNQKAGAWLRPWIEQAGGAGAPGKVCAVLARAGVGKTTFLIQLALDELLLGHEVLHVALGKGLSQVEARYEALTQARLVDLSAHEREAARIQVNRRRAIQSLSTAVVEPRQLARVLQTYRQHLGMRPTLVVVDSGDFAAMAAELDALRALAIETSCNIWLSAQTHRETGPAPLLAALPGVLDLAVFLKPEGDRVLVQVLPVGDRPAPLVEPLALSPDLLRTVGDTRASSIRPQDFTLLSGAAPGSEAAFGELAERRGLAERNFTFADRACARQRGLVVLSDEELSLGDVSWSYLTARTGREFDQSEAFRRVLQSIWHQVNPAGEVFHVGQVLPAGTVKGGTGWAVELAKQLHKPVWVFDQDTSCWYEWFGGDWRACNPPVISQYRFCGTGTRHLSDGGRRAIEQLFARTFDD